MIELGYYAREGRLRGFLEQPWLQAYNGVEGIALAYDDRLTTEAERALSGLIPETWQGTVEHSRMVAMLLAGVAQRWEGPAGVDLPEDILPHYLGDHLDAWWRWFSLRAEKRKLSPLVVEVTAGEGFGREARPEGYSERESFYRYRIRRSRGARLQAASSGGRIVDREATPRRHGTTGGFLVDNFTGDTWSLTAAHVCGDRTGHAHAMPLPRAAPMVRREIGNLLRTIGLSRFRAESCPPFWSSWPEAVSMPKCTIDDAPETRGLDVAMHRVARKKGLLPVNIVQLADVSPVLDLTFCGATSGLRRVAPTSLSIWHSYELNGAEMCIHDCVQVRLVDRPYIRTDLSRGGDSGAWLLARSRLGICWAGLLTGGDGDRAGIVPARRIARAIEDELGISVSAYV